MNIAVILGSTRPTYRLGDRIAKWIMTETQRYTKATFTLLDLKDYDLPFFFEERGPRGNQGRKIPQNIQKWVDDMAKADAYLFIVPEYNSAAPAALKNALDLLGYEGKRKPAALIGYTDGSNGGMYAPFQLRPVLGELEIIAIPAVQIILNADKVLSENGQPVSEEKDNLERRFNKVMESLLWYAHALKNAREEDSDSHS